MSYNGADARIERLGLTSLWTELAEILTGFRLLLKEEQDSNGGAAVRELLDRQFAIADGFFAFGFTRGKHLSWVVFWAIAGLVYYAASTS